VSLVDQGLTEVPADIAARLGATATSLNATENALRPPANLSAFTKLHTLILDKNDLENLVGLPTMPSVTTFWFNNNKVRAAPRLPAPHTRRSRFVHSVPRAHTLKQDTC
jgi:Leucine-rich repeat (LRR) protein